MLFILCSTAFSPNKCLHRWKELYVRFVHPVQYGIVTERITLPRPDDEILSGHDEDVSSIHDGIASSIRTCHCEVLDVYRVNGVMYLDF